MPKILVAFITLCWVAPLALACGDDRLERGLSPAVEEAVPTSEKEMEMTEAERRRQETEEEEEASRKGFEQVEKEAHGER